MDSVICQQTQLFTQRSTPALMHAGGRQVVLGSYSASHLGDALCMSHLPRLLSRCRGVRVFVSRERHMEAVFRNNPHVAGFASGPLVRPGHGVSRCGHIMQRLAQGLGLPVEPVNRPEVFLDPTERAWARAQRAAWPTGRPVCIVSCSAVSDAGNVQSVDWARMVRILSRRYTVVQPAAAEQVLPGVIAYRQLTTRQYVALFAVADAFCGGTSAGSHIAAAFDVPAMVVAWRSMIDSLNFPVSNDSFKAWFLYPQHWFVASEDVTFGNWDNDALEAVLDQMRLHGQNGRPPAAVIHPRVPCGFVPKAPPQLRTISGGRLVAQRCV